MREWGKVWNALVDTLHQIADKHGWETERRTHKALFRVARYLSAVAGDPELHPEFFRAYSINRDAHHNRYRPEYLQRRAKEVSPLIDRFRQASAQVDQGRAATR